MEDPTYVLIHSPVVGPTTWRPVADVLEDRGREATIPSLLGVQDATPPHWRWCADRVVEAIGTEPGPVVLLAHSGAGPLLPIVGTEIAREVRAYVFVDATIPERTGSTPIAPADLLDALEALAIDGRVPKWSRWWGEEEAMRGLVPDDAIRERLEDELPSLPLMYFREAVPPSGTTVAGCAVRLSAVQRDLRAGRPGGPVSRMADASRPG